MRKIIGRFLKDKGGATAIEYGLIVGVLSLAMVAGFSEFAQRADQHVRLFRHQRS